MCDLMYYHNIVPQGTIDIILIHLLTGVKILYIQLDTKFSFHGITYVELDL